MTNLPPPDPRSSQREPLGFDEFIGIFVALSTIGAILFWSFSRRHEGLNLSFLPVPSPSPQVTVTPPTATANPTPVSPAPTPPETQVSPSPTTIPTQPPQALLPVPLPAPAPPPPPATQRIVPAPVPAPVPSPIPTQSPTPSPSPVQPVSFVDVPPNFWARPYIDALATRGIIRGFTDKYFRPDQPVTRAEFAAILQAAFDKNVVGQRVSEFQDIPADFWAAPAIDRATNDKFLKGYPGNVFRPTQEIPRVQTLVALVSGLNLPTPSDPAKVLQVYQDAIAIPSYATNQVAAATQAKLVVNYPTQNLLKPNQNATRAEVAALVYQALVNLGKAQPIQSQYIVQPPQ